MVNLYYKILFVIQNIQLVMVFLNYDTIYNCDQILLNLSSNMIMYYDIKHTNSKYFLRSEKILITYRPYIFHLYYNYA